MTALKPHLFILMVVALLVGACKPVFAEAGLRRRSPDFEVPSKLRPRVNFWKDIFTRYGENQMVVHHREFPQIRFGVLDFGQAAAELTPVQLEKLKRERSNEEIKRLKAVFKHLASGARPETDEEQDIVEQMSFLPGGISKYQLVVDQDLIRTQTGIKEKFREAVLRSGRYLPIMERIFRDYGLPIELTRLPYIESSFDYEAYSSVGAAGIWQFMRRTATLYMSVNALVDERRDPIEATRAAARYLEEAFNDLGTWPLAVTSYNHGVAGVARKVRQFGTSNLADIIEDPIDRAFGFASTNFYPEFLAALEVDENYQYYFPELRKPPALQIAQFRVPKAISIAALARSIGVGLSELRDLNYAISDRVWSGRSQLPRGYLLKVPAEYEGRLGGMRLVETEPQPAAPPSSAVNGGNVYRVRDGDTLLSIAKKFQMSVEKLKQANGLTNERLTVGQSLVVGGSPAVKKVEPHIESAPKKVSSELPHRKGGYKVQRGDNLWSVARKLGCKVQDLKAVNGLRHNDIREGQTLKIPK